MTKSDLADAIYSKLGAEVTKKGASQIVDVVFETIKQTLSSGEDMKISGFGNFMVRRKKQRIGRNPQTGVEMIISERKVVSFKVSQVLKSNLNQ